MILPILFHTSAPYLEMLNRWLGLSKRSATTDCEAAWMEVLDDCPLRDPYGEFFIHDTMSQSKEDDILRFQVSLERLW